VVKSSVTFWRFSSRVYFFYILVVWGSPPIGACSLLRVNKSGSFYLPPPEFFSLTSDFFGRWLPCFFSLFNFSKVCPPSPRCDPPLLPFQLIGVPPLFTAVLNLWLGFNTSSFSFFTRMKAGFSGPFGRSGFFPCGPRFGARDEPPLKPCVLPFVVLESGFLEWDLSSPISGSSVFPQKRRPTKMSPFLRPPFPFRLGALSSPTSVWQTFCLFRGQRGL